LKLVKYLNKKYNISSNRIIKFILKEGKVTLNSRIIKKNINIKDNENYIISSDCLDIKSNYNLLGIKQVFYKNNIIIVFKPALMPTHPNICFENQTLMNYLITKYEHLKHLSNLPGLYQNGLINRLDNKTSGVVLVSIRGRLLYMLFHQY